MLEDEGKTRDEQQDFTSSREEGNELSHIEGFQRETAAYGVCLAELHSKDIMPSLTFNVALRENGVIAVNCTSKLRGCHELKASKFLSGLHSWNVGLTWLRKSCLTCSIPCSFNV